MLVTLLVLYSVRPLLRSEVRRRKALSVLLVAAFFVPSTGRPPSAHAHDQYGRTRSIVPIAPEPQVHTLDGPEEITRFGGQQMLREGTVIPPTIGRLVNLGRRWAFIPADDVAPHRHELAARDFLSTNPPPAHQSSQSDLIRRADGEPLDAVGNSETVIVLCENQMLQRIVEAVRENASDDRWEISGEILEFFDQNRLLIRTVQRANFD